MFSPRSSLTGTPHHSGSGSSSAANKHVNFNRGGDPDEKKREKFLTAKYGAHQMALIRKRLRVEMWMYERLQEIYGAVRLNTNIYILSLSKLSVH